MDVLVPKENNNDESVIITKIHFTNGDYVEKEQELFEFETSKTAIAIEAPISGYVQCQYKEGDEIAVNSVVCTVDENSSKNPTLVSSENGKEEVFIDAPTKDDEVNENLKNQNFSKLASSLNDPVTHSAKNKHWVTSRILNGKNVKQFKIQQSAESISNNLDEITLEVETSNLSYVDATLSMRKRAEIKALGVTGGGVFQSTIGVSLPIADRDIANPYNNNGIQDLVIYEANMLLSGDYAELNACYIGDNQVRNYTSVVPGLSLDLNNDLTVVAIQPQYTVSLPFLQEAMSEVTLRFADGALDKGDLDPTTFTVSDLSHTDTTFMLPLLNSSQALILGIVKRIDLSAYHIYATFDHRVSSGLMVSKFLTELSGRVSSYFSSSQTKKCCNFCGIDAGAAKQYNRPGLFVLANDTETSYICWSCING